VTEHHLAEDDKLLTEVAMERDPRAPRRRELPYPLARVDANVTGMLCWFLSAGGLVAVSRDETHSVASAVAHGLRVLGDPAALVAGVDVWRGAAGEFGGALTRLPGTVSAEAEWWLAGSGPAMRCRSTSCRGPATVTCGRRCVRSRARNRRPPNLP
jgi:hypothetical protein